MEIKTKKEVLKENSEYKTLINAVISRVGIDSKVVLINNNLKFRNHGIF